MELANLHMCKCVYVRMQYADTKNAILAWRAWIPITVGGNPRGGVEPYGRGGAYGWSWAYGQGELTDSDIAYKQMLNPSRFY